MYIMKQIKNFTSKLKNRIFSMISFIFPRWVNLLNIYFLRKTSTFIKSKYSKNRQWSKSIVYFGLWFGVICAFTFTYYNYRFLFIISYLWWIPVVIIFLTFFALIKKYYKYANLNFIQIFF